MKDRPRYALVLDNEFHRHEYFEEELGGAGYETEHAYTSEQAIEAMKERSYDVVTLDYDLTLTRKRGAVKVDTGMDVVRAMVAPESVLLRPARVVVHSVNDWGAWRMVAALHGAGFAVERDGYKGRGR